VFVLDVLGREIVTRCLPDRARHTIGGTEFVVRRNVHGSMLDEEWTVIAGGHRREFCTSQHVYSAGEIEAALLSAGFAKVLLAGTFNGTAPYDEDARRLVAIARTE